jgi:hypothetical protein
MYDIFFIVYDNESLKTEIRKKFPLAKFCILDENTNMQSLLESAQKRSLTKMFWVINVDHEVKDNFDFNYQATNWDNTVVHVFKEETKDLYTGVYLVPKTYRITKNEADNMFFINKKEVPTIASKIREHDLYFIIHNLELLKHKIKEQFPLAKFCIIDEYSSIHEALTSIQSNSITKMFWVVNIDHKVKDNFDLNYEVPKWDQKYLHVFKEEKTDSYTGVYLVPKTYRITKNEADNMFFINKKEVPMIASMYDYSVFAVETYEDYLKAKDNSLTEMFYIVFSDLKVLNTFKFDYVVDKSLKNVAHVFKNSEFHDGVFITSKTQKITEKEFNSRFIINRTEVDIEASKFENFEIIECTSYEDYLEKIKLVKSKMAYVITPEIQVENFSFDYQVPYWNQDKVHVFKNNKYFDGICLLPSTRTVSQKEFDYKFFVNKIEVDIIASAPKLFDIVFISYAEPNADENYQNLINRFPRAKRIHGVKGIHQAHKEAAKIATTSMFWVVDGDAHIVDDFDFNYQVPFWDYDTVHVWRSQNPINGLQYGYGGVKLLPTTLTKNLNVTTVDMTTSISSKFKAVSIVSNISKFNTDEFNTWKSAFRECVKLSSRVITGQKDNESLSRLDVWCTEGENEQYGKLAINGAQAGREFGSKHKGNSDMLAKINDWQWLETEFKNHTGLIC